MLWNKINIYLFIQICKYCFLILFIFLSIAWILQITRLFTISNFIGIEILDILFLSFYLIPNLITIILPFILIFGLLLCFIKLDKDNELVAILSLGFGLKPFKNSLNLFCIIFLLLFIFLNTYFAPIVYEKYKIREFDLRNNLNFDNLIFSNFLNLNKTTILDFKKEKNNYQDILISFSDEKENIVFAKQGNIFSNDNFYNFQLRDGFKISINNNKQIEKLEFENYILKIKNKNIKKTEIADKNTFTVFDDLSRKNYTNITFKIIDVVLILYIIIFFYINNLKRINFETTNNLFFSLYCIILIIINQILKNSQTEIFNYFLVIMSLIFSTILISYIRKKYEKN